MQLINENWITKNILATAIFEYPILIITKLPISENADTKSNIPSNFIGVILKFCFLLNSRNIGIKTEKMETYIKIFAICSIIGV